MKYREILRPQLRIDEDERRYPYTDTTGHLSIGVGRNLTSVGVRPDEIDLMLENDIKDAEQIARVLVPRFADLSDSRKAVLCNMAFNLGPRLKGFTRFLDLVNAGQWSMAAAEMLDSRWAAQVKQRATRLSLQMKEG